MLSIPRGSGALQIVRLRRGRESLTQLRRVVPDPKNGGELVVQAFSIKDEVPLLDAVIDALVKIRRHVANGQAGAEPKAESPTREPRMRRTAHAQRSLPLPNPGSGVQPAAAPYAPDFDDSDLSNIF